MKGISRDLAVAIGVAVSLEEAEHDRRVGDDPNRPRRSTDPFGEVVEARWPVCQRCEQPDLVRDEEVFRRHEALGDLE
jgi:hypothetical protein